MATKKEILAYAKQHGFIYPKEKVILLFILLGGAVGGLLPYYQWDYGYY
ncbi:Uncharacterised protein [Moraxella caprae]|uniref:Uncharacterized protein n=1 Tax=Moraxella caprae TaxID=90240 RepID=A0A378R442_9GAMM|nr:hypothetical protein [Moraxella caprae]STZ09447.1 Uncharacterised protein [Moraxella caprae]